MVIQDDDDLAGLMIFQTSNHLFRVQMEYHQNTYQEGRSGTP
jgi:hypothetical protein